VDQKAKLRFAVLLILVISAGAVSFGAAPSPARKTKSMRPGANAVGVRDIVPRAVMFREVPGRGLLIKTWVNDVGPFSFAIDTGAGATLLSARVAREAQVKIKSVRATSITGLSGSSTSAQTATISSVAIGDSENYLPAKGLVMVTSGLPREIDGVLDPTEALSPLGYVIDLPRGELSTFDPNDMPLQLDAQSTEGAVVPWLRESHGRRPFVLLDNGDRALLDTGSTLGLAIKDRDQSNQRISGYAVRDVGGGQVSARRARPSTIAIGSLTLRNIPTDVISGAAANAPVLLGLNALRPFRLRFDPLHRLIEITPSVGRPNSR
jgi:predicted aspartyl protease